MKYEKQERWTVLVLFLFGVTLMICMGKEIHDEGKKNALHLSEVRSVQSGDGRASHDSGDGGSVP